MKGKGTTDTIFIVRQMQERFGSGGKKLCFGFVDLEKAFGGVLEELVRWVMCRLGVGEWLVLAIVSVYTSAGTVVGAVCGDRDCFQVWVGMHQGSMLGPFVMEAFSGEFRVVLFW